MSKFSSFSVAYFRRIAPAYLPAKREDLIQKRLAHTLANAQAKRIPAYTEPTKVEALALLSAMADLLAGGAEPEQIRALGAVKTVKAASKVVAMRKGRLHGNVKVRVSDLRKMGIAI